MENRKLIATAKNMDAIVKFIGGFMRAFGIVFAIFAVLVAVVGEPMFVDGTFSMDLDFVKLHLADGYDEITPFIRIYIAVGLVSVSVLCFVIRYAIDLLRKILAPMKEGRPFDAEVPAHLRKIAWITLIAGGVLQLLGIAERVCMIHACPMEEIFSSAAIASVEYVFAMDFSFVWIFCIILFLSYIFSYGQCLQQESDETL